MATLTERINARKHGYVEGAPGSCDLCSAGHITRADYEADHANAHRPSWLRRLTDQDRTSTIYADGCGPDGTAA